MSWLLKTLSPNILEHSADTWYSIRELFASLSKAHINTLLGLLSNTKKLDMKVGQYITKMKGFAMELTAVGKNIDDNELKGYILNGLGVDYLPSLHL
jgi:hypothetical protein